MAICNKDCFHCPFEDCINDKMDASDYAEADDRDRKLKGTEKQRKRAAAKRSYYEKTGRKF